MREETANPCLPHCSRRGFTLVELLAVVTIMLVLMGMIMGGITAVRNAARKNKVKADITALEHAVKAYLNDTGTLPLPEKEKTPQHLSDPLYFAEPRYFAESNDSVNVVYQLTTTNNPRNAIYLEARDNVSPGVFQDPWGTQYAFKFDADYNGVLDYPGLPAIPALTGENIPSPVVVISYGPNKLQDYPNRVDYPKTGNPGTGDDFISAVWMSRSAK